MHDATHKTTIRPTPTADLSRTDMTLVSKRRSDVSFAALVTGLFFAAAVWNVLDHVMWRDEVRCWQFAVHSSSLTELRANLRYEGCPYLWYGLLWLLARVTTNPIAMKLLHVAIASGTVFLFAWRAPFSRAARLLFPLGYYTFFEYTTLSRNYGIVLLGVVAATTFITAPRRRPLALGFVLLLLTQCSIWGAGIAGVLFLSTALEWTILAPRERRTPWWVTLVLGGIVLGGVGLCYYSSLPGPGRSFVMRWPNDMSVAERFMVSIRGVFRAYVPIPLPKRTFWGSNILDASTTAGFLGGCAVLATASLLFLRRPAALVPLLLGSAGLIAFNTLLFESSVRHDGFFYVLLIAAFWLGASAATVSISWPRAVRISECLAAQRGKLLILLLTAQAIGGVEAMILDHLHPFTAAAEVAEFIRREVPGDPVICGYDDRSATSVGFYLNRPIHSAQTDLVPKFIVQDERTRHPRTIERLVERVAGLRTESTRKIVIVLDPDGDAEFTAWCAAHRERDPHWQRLGRFPDSTVPDEAATVYVVR